MWKMVIAATVLMFPASLFAENVTLVWELPTENDDGSPLTDLAGIRIYLLVHDTEDDSTTTWTHEGVLSGEHRYVATSYNDDGEESVLSNYAETVVDGLKVSSNTVYTMIKQTNKMIFLPVGTIQVGTDCDETQPIGPYHIVPRQQVNWSGNIRPDAVFAECE